MGGNSGTVSFEARTKVGVGEEMVACLGRFDERCDDELVPNGFEPVAVNFSNRLISD